MCAYRPAGGRPKRMKERKSLLFLSLSGSTPTHYKPSRLYFSPPMFYLGQSTTSLAGWCCMNERGGLIHLVSGRDTQSSGKPE